MVDNDHSKEISRDEISANFMLKEYEYHAQEKFRKVEQGESRFNILIAIVTALLGGAGALATARGEPVLYWIEQNRHVFLFALSITLTFGYLTFLRTIHRDLDIDKEKRALNKIRRYFIKKDFYISEFLGPIDDKLHSKPEWKDIIPNEGNLVQFVQLINSLLVGVILMVLWEVRISIGVSGFLCAWIVQFMWLKIRYHLAENEKHE